MYLRIICGLSSARSTKICLFFTYLLFSFRALCVCVCLYVILHTEKCVKCFILVETHSLVLFNVCYPCNNFASVISEYQCLKKVCTCQRGPDSFILPVECSGICVQTFRYHLLTEVKVNRNIFHPV